jgi:serine/threonine protein kinase
MRACLAKSRPCYSATHVTLLGVGAFGEVFSGRLRTNNRRVAVKVLFAGGALDEDGDPVDSNAEQDFQKECAALQRVNSPRI